MSRKLVSTLFVASLSCVLASFAWAASPNVTIKAGHYPTTIGIKGTWYCNPSTVTVPVTLSFNPPWDMTKGPKLATIASAWIDKSQAYNGSTFPDATVALQAVESPSAEKKYSFFKKASAGLYHYGESSPNTGDNFQLAPALRIIFFPATVGKTVTQRTSFVTSDGSVPATTVTKVVAKGTVVVGAGTFNDSAMVQVKLSMGGSEPRSLILYIWVAPYVGSVAEIQSLDNETNELFTTAFSYKWLRSLDLP